MFNKIVNIGFNGYAALLSVIAIVAYVNFNDGSSLWHLIWYLQFYIVIGWFIWVNFKITENVLVHSLVIALGLYFAYELSMDIYKIYDLEGWDKLYRKRVINYIVGLGIATGLLVLPVCKVLIKWLRNVLKKR